MKFLTLCRLEMPRKIQNVLANSAKVVYSGGRRQVSPPQDPNAVRCRFTNESFARCLDPAREAFAEGVEIFSSTLTKDSRKICLARQASCMEDVQSAVTDAKARYDSGRQNHNVSMWLSKLSTRIGYYSNIMDVLVQHHPQYAALAWGAMKVLFVVRPRTFRRGDLG